MTSSILNLAPLVNSKFLRLDLFCTILGISLASSACAQPRYAVTDLGTLPGADISVGQGINDRGDVVGSCNGPVLGQVGFVWSNGAMTKIGKLSGGNFSYATAINLFGLVVGDGDTGNWRPQSWVTSARGLFNIFPNNGGNTHAIGVNNLGVICGYYTKSLSGGAGSWRGALWSADPKDPTKYRTTDLPSIPGNDAKFTSAIPFGFNQLGQAAGWAVNDILGQHAAFWNSDAAHSIVDLGTFPGDWSSIAWGINDLGQVVGESHPAYGSRPVIWNNDAAHTPSELSLLPGDNYGTAVAMNSLGHILGTSTTSSPGTGNTGVLRPIVWRDGGVFEVQSLLDTATGAGWTVSQVTAINNRGQIVGTGVHNGVSRAFILSPLAQ